jgi:hypothetical protein
LDELFGEAEVNNVHHMRVLANSHKEVIGLDITMENVFLMHELDPVEYLLPKLEDCSKAEPFAAFGEEILKTGA